MARRGENIYKRKDGRWEGRILKEDGKYQSFYAANYKAVKEKMRGFQEAVVPEAVQLPRQGISAADLLISWLDETAALRVKPTTYHSYHSCIYQYMVPFFTKGKHKTLDREGVAAFVQSVKANKALANATQKKILSIFKAALKDIAKALPQYLQLADMVILPRAQPQEVEIFSVQEQKCLEQAILRGRDKQLFGIFLCFYTGIRIGELCALQWKDIDFQQRIINIRHTVCRVKNQEGGNNKTILMVGTPKSHKSVRSIPLPEFLQKLAAEYYPAGADRDIYVFSDTHNPADPRNFQHVFQMLLRKNSIPHRKFHAIRHSFATRALELGVDIKTISELLGHSNVSITLNVYAHCLLEQKKAAMEKFQAMYIGNL